MTEVAETKEASSESIHKSVLLQEILDGLMLNEGSVVLDGTINGGGHSSAICEQIGEHGVLIGIDLDTTALARAKKRLTKCAARVILEEENYRNMSKVLMAHNVTHINGLLLDLGLSSDQLETGERGFTFKKEEPLKLTFAQNSATQTLTAHMIVNEWDKEHIEEILRGYGEERFARRIAEHIVKARKEKPIQTTTELVRIIENAVPTWYQFRRLHPATKTFQALRIAVNDEIESLREGLQKGIGLLSPKGRFAVISFHSIEDRIVKRTFRDAQSEGKGTIITKKPVTPSVEEVNTNPRARSAKLRIFEKQ